MKKLSIILAGVLFVFFLSACGGNCKHGDDENTEDVVNTETDTDTEVEEVKKEKTQEELIIGDWYDEAAISGFDIIFNADGSFFWHSGSDEGEDTWKITDDGKFHYFAQDFEILELTDKVFKITDGETETKFERN